MMKIRKLSHSDTKAFFTLRLEGLKICPSAFGESAVEFEAKGPEAVEQRLRLMENHQSDFLLGAFSETEEMVGVVGFRRENAKKTLHIGILWGMFVAPPVRRQGVGRALVAQLIEHARQTQGLKQIKLTVEATNEAARSLYESFGFEVWGEEPQALLVDGRFLNELHMTLLNIGN